MAAPNLMAPSMVNRLLGLMPGAVTVRYGGVDGNGNYEQVPTTFGDGAGVLAAMPSVVVADDYFPGLGLDESTGQARGINAQIEVGDYGWTVRAIEPGVSPGEVRLMLSNRTSA